jgi:hypothetical protein
VSDKHGLLTMLMITRLGWHHQTTGYVQLFSGYHLYSSPIYLFSLFSSVYLNDFGRVGYDMISTGTKHWLPEHAVA